MCVCVCGYVSISIWVGWISNSSSKAISFLKEQLLCSVKLEIKITKSELKVFNDLNFFFLESVASYKTSINGYGLSLWQLNQFQRFLGKTY